MQPGPIYFLTPRKCSVFGVHCEAIPRQVNFLTDESGEVEKGANAVISRLHYFFDVHGLEETDIYLHHGCFNARRKKKLEMCACRPRNAIGHAPLRFEKEVVPSGDRWPSRDHTMDCLMCLLCCYIIHDNR